FRWFLKWAAEQYLIESRTVNDGRPVIKKIDRPVIWLEMGELARLMGLELAAGSLLDRARDIFCLQCFTGLRYSDVMALLKSSVKSGHIEVTTIKTGTVLRIELNRHSRAILNKYSRTPGEKAMPQLDSSTLNKYIKAVASMAGINDPVTITQYYGSERRSVTRPKHEFLSSHAGRRTFICNALALGISPVVVMKWTGHTEYASMKPYIDVADSTKSRAMTLFDAIDSDY
ncbi:MAG: site-specific integrase, partial [Muribaculaceae bacterium]|nr:site-specific integrase [Muribaculaceae bacterium]